MHYQRHDWIQILHNKIPSNNIFIHLSPKLFPGHVLPEDDDEDDFIIKPKQKPKKKADKKKEVKVSRTNKPSQSAAQKRNQNDR